MAIQSMFLTTQLAVLRQHWNYAIKGDGTRKAHNSCNSLPHSSTTQVAQHILKLHQASLYAQALCPLRTRRFHQSKN